MNLFNSKVLSQFINSFQFPSEAEMENKLKIIRAWQKALKDSDLEKTKEKEVQGTFFHKFFVEILGYKSITEGEDSWSFIQEPTTEIDALTPDGSLGFYSKERKLTRCVIELKDAKTILDKKQNNRIDRQSPVEQAFNYATKYEDCNWILVSNFREIRIYNKIKSQMNYEKFDLLELDLEKNFQKFYFLLNSTNFLSEDNTSVIDLLLQESLFQEEDITKKFYTQYKSLRLRLLDHLVENNSNINKDVLLEKTQKLLDRFIFVLFCEDTRYLLPANISSDTYQRAIHSFSPSDQRAWTEFKGLFDAIDQGNYRVNPPINAYNGGLFSPDPVLDSLQLKDDIWKELIDLAKFDYESDLNVNILGHIFEQSISDLESIKESINIVQENGDYILTEDGNKIQVGSIEKLVEKTGKRKKDGIFYTPEYITRYMIENTVGKFLEENPSRLTDIKILDPACGSGAFLNQAHSYLKQLWDIAYEEGRVKSEFAEAGPLFDYNPVENDRSILLNNIYGVDLNNESVEITKLSLWLKTAAKDQKLQNLDKNIKQGNSIVDDIEYDGNNAFNWQDNFKDILDEGGFDVVIGNPPYVRQELISEIKPYLSGKYEVYTGVSDLFVYFFEKGLSLLREGGYFSFIVSNKFLRTGYGKKLTHYIQSNYAIVELIDFGDIQIFDGATTYPCIITIKKETPKEVQKVRFLRINSKEEIDTLNSIAIENSISIEIAAKDDTWRLESKQDSSLITRLEESYPKLDKIIAGNANYGIKTGYNEAFVIDSNLKDELCRKDSNSSEIIKPLLRGKDISRYHYEWEKQWLIFTRRGINIEEFPAIRDYLLQFKDKLEPGKGRKPGPYKWYEIQDNVSYYKEFEKPKIIYQVFQVEPLFTFDDKGFYTNNAVWIMPTSDIYLVGILNSRLGWYLITKYCTQIQNGYQLIYDYLKNIPIPEINETDKEELGMKVKSIIELYDNAVKRNQGYVDILINEYRPRKVSQRIKDFYRLGFNEFTDELTKQKVKITLAQKEDLLKWFRDKQSDMNQLVNEIKKLENEINLHVFRIYNLSDDEINLINSGTR